MAPARVVGLAATVMIVIIMVAAVAFSPVVATQQHIKQAHLHSPFQQ
jgi:hypothetical protein